MSVTGDHPQDPVDVTGLGYLALEATDLGAWHAFATDVLGLMASTGADGDEARLTLRLDERAQRITVDRGGRDGLAAVGLEVRDARALDAAQRRLEAEGIAVERGSAEDAARRDVSGLIRFAGPSDLPYEIAYGARESLDPFVSPRGHRFVTAGQGLGHAFLLVTDYEAALDFHTRVLGFGVSDFFFNAEHRANLAFMHCNPRHHTIGIAGPVPPPMVGLQHIMVQVDDLDAVGRAYDRCHAGAAPLTTLLGRHSNDHMLSFYARTPSGFDVELGWGARTVGPGWVTTTLTGPDLWGHQPTAAPPAVQVPPPSVEHPEPAPVVG